MSCGWTQGGEHDTSYSSRDVFVVHGTGRLGCGLVCPPDGRADNTGRQASPWDIASCLEGKRDVAAGGTVFLLEGAYRRRPRERFEIRLVGTADKPVHIRPYPNGRVLVLIFCVICLS